LIFFVKWILKGGKGLFLSLLKRMCQKTFDKTVKGFTLLATQRKSIPLNMKKIKA
jgi:hypothetical protein